MTGPGRERTFVQFAASRVAHELSVQQVGTFPALAELIIPAQDEWPSAGDVVRPDAVERMCADSFAVRDAVSTVLDAVHGAALSAGADSLRAIATHERQAAAVKEVESALPVQFKTFVNCVYEVYYSDPGVQRVIEQRTGYRVRAAVDGVSVAQFEDVLLKVADVGIRSKRVRVVEEGR